MDHPHEPGAARARSRWVLLGFLAVAAYFLWTEHRAHLMGVLPYLLVPAQTTQRPAVTGPYARIRHPQYVAFVVIMFGFLLQWPTLITLAMFPVLLVVYARLARAEERDMEAAFGQEYLAYRARTPAFVPHLEMPDTGTA